MSKEQYVVDYIVEWELDKKTPDTLYRYIDDGKGYWCEGLSLLDDGKWEESHIGIGLVRELHNEYYDRVTKEQAEELAKQLGASIYDN